MLTRMLFVVAIAVGIAYEYALLFRPVATVAAAGARPYALEEFGKGERIGQTFRSSEDGLTSFDVQMSADRPVTIDVTWRLLGWAPYKIDDHWVPIYEFPATLDLPAGKSWQHFVFPPIVPSENVIYQFDVVKTAIRSRDQAGIAPAVAIIGSDDGPLTDGNLIAGDRQIVDRDIVYAAHTATRFERFRMRANPYLPRPLRYAWLQLAALALYDAAVAAFAFDVIVGRREEPPTADARPVRV
ncbi:MAG TPA: hypothetical protein VFA59_20260 [Vicinamibacterales bacterium]|nr:hypothetical protein [Vicinamibacterales bacterium]